MFTAHAVCEKRRGNSKSRKERVQYIRQCLGLRDEGRLRNMTGVSRIVNTNLHPDILLWSPQGRKMVMVELTAPWEERCEEAYQCKKVKYQDLADEVRSKGWSVLVFCGKMGCRRFPAQSVWKILQQHWESEEHQAGSIKKTRQCNDQ